MALLASHGAHPLSHNSIRTQGALTQLDTPNPVLYINFPEVRAATVTTTW